MEYILHWYSGYVSPEDNIHIYMLPWWLSGKVCLPTQEMWFRSLGQEESLEKEMAAHPSILAWEIPCTEMPGMRLQRVRHNWATGHAHMPSGLQVPRKRAGVKLRTSCKQWCPDVRTCQSTKECQEASGAQSIRGTSRSSLLDVSEILLTLPRKCQWKFLTSQVKHDYSPGSRYSEISENCTTC